MAILDDTVLLLKKIGITVIIYLVPVTIMVGGLHLTKHILGEQEQKPVNEVPSKTIQSKI